MSGDAIKFKEELGQVVENVQIAYTLFLNSILLKFCITSNIIYLKGIALDPVLMTGQALNIGRGVFRAASAAVGGLAAVGVATVYSPAVEIPGVNEFQVKWGRGYGYKTSTDYVFSDVYRRYLTDEQWADAVAKNAPKNKILDGRFFNKLHENQAIMQIMHKEATVNEKRVIGLRNF